jgi:hypothetical protein
MKTYGAVALSSRALAIGTAGAAVVAYQEEASCQLESPIAEGFLKEQV